MYRDVKISSALITGSKVKVCNNEWTSFAAFSKVAVLSGSPLVAGPMATNLKESEAMGVLQLLHIFVGNEYQLDGLQSIVTPAWALENHLLTCRNNNMTSPSSLIKTGEKTIVLDLVCTSNVTSLQQATKLSVVALKLDVLPVTPFESVLEALERLPSMEQNLELVAALSSLTELSSLDMLTGGDGLWPQLASLRKLTTFRLRHYCLGGSIPANLLDGGWPRLKEFVVVPVASAIGAMIPGPRTVSSCGLSGSLPDMRPPITTSAGNQSNSTVLDRLELSNNQLAGQLPAYLVWLARHVLLQNNNFYGSIPSALRRKDDTLLPAAVSSLDLSRNQLTVSQLRAAALLNDDVRSCC
jgi:hypothetical protein